jgi:hypothetical protein
MTKKTGRIRKEIVESHPKEGTPSVLEFVGLLLEGGSG